MTITTVTSDESAPDSRLRQRIKEAALLPCNLLRFVRRMRRRFGSYVSTAMLVYGVNQGMQFQLAYMATVMYYTDTLGVDGATMGRIFTIGRMPWSMKPLFGLISDVVPILGLHRNPYLAIAGLLGLVGTVGPGLLAPSATGFLPFMLAGSLATAWPDVVVDATSAELAKDYPENASDFQSLCWGSGSLGSFIGASISGVLVLQLRPRGLLCLCGLAALAALVPGLLRKLPEKRVPRGVHKSKRRWLQKHAGLAVLALLLCASCLGLSLMQLYLQTPGGRAAVTLGCAAVLAISLCVILGRIAAVLAKVAVFIFLHECMTPQVSDAMVQWEKNAEDGPKFSPMLIGWTGCVASMTFFLAVVIFNRYLTKVSYRKIFAVTQVCMMGISAMDIILVKRWNLKLGIPDEVMLFGDAATHQCFLSFFMMPVFVLASKVCPQEVEATLFALLMSLMQFGYNVGSLFGSSLLEFMGCVDGNWDNFYLVVAVKALSRVLPLFMIPFLVPSLTPEDPIFEDWSQRADSENGVPDAGAKLPEEDNLERAPQEKPGKEAPALGEDRPAKVAQGDIVEDLGARGRPAVILSTVGEHQLEEEKGAGGRQKTAGPIIMSV